MKSPGSISGFTHSQPLSLNHWSVSSVQSNRSRLIQPPSGYIRVSSTRVTTGRARARTSSPGGGSGSIQVLYEYSRAESVLTSGCSLKYCSKSGAVPVITASPPSLGPFGSLVKSAHEFQAVTRMQYRCGVFTGRFTALERRARSELCSGRDVGRVDSPGLGGLGYSVAKDGMRSDLTAVESAMARCQACKRATMQVSWLTCGHGALPWLGSSGVGKASVPPSSFVVSKRSDRRSGTGLKWAE